LTYSNFRFSYPESTLGETIMLRILLTLAVTAGTFAITSDRAAAQNAQVDRGKYLAAIGGCTDCHTPGHFLGKPDMARFLGGSDVAFEIPGLGTFVGPNLTPDKETGLGNWTGDQIVTAVTTGKRPDGRMLAPVMPYMGLQALTRDDALAIAAYLKSLPAVKNKVPGPFGPTEKATVLVMKIVPGDGMPKPPAQAK
jgi:mono/diheme cytochrome c family protein